MQEQNSKDTNIDPSTLPEIPDGQVPELLKNMEVGTIESGYYVPLKRVASVRVQLTNIKTYSDKVFTSEQVEGGIVIWRSE